MDLFSCESNAIYKSASTGGDIKTEAKMKYYVIYKLLQIVTRIKAQRDSCG